MTIGKYTLHQIDSGFFALDGGAMFGIIPKPLWTKTNIADDRNRIKLTTRNLLLVNDSRKILIDTGMGQKWDKKSKDIYAIDQTESELTNSLQFLGIEPEDITDVLLTHLHFDHTGGSTVLRNNKLEPAFPNASYYVQEQNFEWAQHSTERDKGSYIKENFEILAKEGLLKVLKGNVEKLDEEISIVRVNGHTRGQQLFHLHDSSTNLLYCADILPTAGHLPLQYIPGYDLQPLITLQERKLLWKKAAEEDWFLFLEHDPENCCIKIESTEDGYLVAEQYDRLP